MPTKTINADRRRGQIVPRGPGKWLLRVTLREYTDADGKKRRDTKAQTFSGTRQEAEAALTALLGKKDAGRLPRSTKATVAELAEGWLASRQSIRERTRMNYQDRLRYYVLPHFGTWRVQQITKPAVRLWVADLATRYSPDTVRQGALTLSQVLDHAIDEGLLADNPCRGVELPQKAETGTRTVLTPPQMARLIAAIREEKHGPLFTVLLDAGLRPGEAFALAWDDVVRGVDEATGLPYTALTITKALTQVAKRVWRVGPVKTRKGRRVVVLSPTGAEAIERQRARDHGVSLVFPNDEGDPLNPDTVYEAWQRTLARHGLPTCSLYTTRHSSITALLDAGVHPKIASERAGHSTTAVTMETYSHVLPSMQLAAAAKLGQALSGAAKG